jgi:hypothetical protein
MSAADPAVHGRKTIMGADLTSGATVTAPCGKRRPAERTSADPARVTCPDCRAWAAGQERELAEQALAAAEIAREYPQLSPFTPGGFTQTASDHEARAKRWDGPPAPVLTQEQVDETYAWADRMMGPDGIFRQPDEDRS